MSKPWPIPQQPKQQSSASTSNSTTTNTGTMLPPYRDIRTVPDDAEPSFSYEQESFFGTGSSNFISSSSRLIEDVEDEFHRRLASTTSRRDSYTGSSGGGGGASGGGGGGMNGGGGSGSGGHPSSFWRSTSQTAAASAAIAAAAAAASTDDRKRSASAPESTTTTTKNTCVGSTTSSNGKVLMSGLGGAMLSAQNHHNHCHGSLPSYRASDSFGSAGSIGKTKKDIAKQRTAERRRKLHAQFGDVDIGHVVDNTSASNNRLESGASDHTNDSGAATNGKSAYAPKFNSISRSDAPQSPYHPLNASVITSTAANSTYQSPFVLPPMNFGEIGSSQHHPPRSVTTTTSTSTVTGVAQTALDRSSSDQSTGSLFYGKTPSSGAVLGKSSSLIFPTGVETSMISNNHAHHNFPLHHGVGGMIDDVDIYYGDGGTHDANDPQADAKRRKINLLLDQCESVRFPFKKKLVLNNLNLTANDIPLQDLCGTSLGNTLFKLSLAGNRLGTVPAQLVQNLPNLKHLDLSQCELHQLPDTWYLPKLTRLNLSHNRLTDFPEEGMLEGLPELHELNMYGNKVAEIIIPNGRNLLSKLETLNLGYNDLAYLPDDLDQLASLKILKVMNNFLEKVPMRVCDMELKSIDVSSNPVIQPPIETCERGISAMKRYYHCLRMEEQSKQKTVEEAKRTPRIQKKKDIKKKAYGAASLLKSLRRTSDDSNQSVGSSITGSHQSLKASSSSLPVPSSAPLPSTLSAPVRSISVPPIDYVHRQNQQEQNKSIEILPDLLAENDEEEEEDEIQIKQPNKDIPPHLPSTVPADGLQKVTDAVSKVTFVDDSRKRTSVEAPYSAPLPIPGTSIIQSEPEAVQEALDAIADDAMMMPDGPAATTVNDTLKVIFVGMAMVGKTSMIKRLIEGRDAVIPTHDERTVGVDIYEWNPKNDRRFEDIDSRIVIKDKELAETCGDVDVKFSVWDFAGQHVYHATHELFFSPRALYVLVWDMGATNRDTHRKQKVAKESFSETGAFKLTYDSSDEEEEAEEPDFTEEEEARRADRALERDIDEKVQFWVDCIQSSAPGAAILPVSSFSDYFENAGGDAEAKRRCSMLKQRLLKHEERRLEGIRERLRLLTDAKRANDIAAVRLRKLLCAYSRPKLIFGDGEESVVRVSGTQYTGFYELTQKIISIATGREKGKWRYPIFHGHVGARIPRMRLQVRDAVRTMRDRFKVVEWGYFINQLRDRGLRSVEDISDALFFLTNIGELSYFGGVVANGKELANPLEDVEKDEDEAGSKGTDDDDEEDVYDDDQAILSMDDTSITAPSTADGSITTVDDFMSTGLSQFVFLNPRWLVAAVACILRHDLDREIKETRRQAASPAGPKQLAHASSFYEAHLNCPVITADDACLLWQAKRITKKAAERAQEYSNNMTITPFEFLQQLLIRFGVFVPIDLSIEKAFLGGKEYAHLIESFTGSPDVREINYENTAEDNAKFFFLPSLLGPCEPSDAWTYKSTDSWKTTLCHSVLFPDGVPPGLMERLTASVLSSIYDVAHRKEITPITDFYGQRLATYEGQLTVKEVLCWRTAFFIKLGAKAPSPDGSMKESIVEIFTHIADRESHLCVGSDYMGVGMRRLIVSGRGQVGDGGRKIWKGGYLLVVKCINRVMDNYGGLEYERHGFCPDCLSKKAVSEAASWEFSKVRSAVMNMEGTLRCQHGHRVDTRLIAGPSDNLQKDRSIAPVRDDEPAPVVPVQDLLRAVVVVGLWDGKSQKVVRVGSGFIVDRKRGLIVTAAHTLMNIWGDKNYPFGENYYGLRQGKVVIGVIPDDKEDGKDMAVFRYFAKIVAKDSSLDNGECRLDACVLKITTRMENDVSGDGEGCGDQPEKLLLNDPRALKNEHLQSLKMTEKCELDEQVRILGYNQGGEGLLAPGESLNRYVDFARGYVCKFHHGQDAEAVITSTNPGTAGVGILGRGGGGVGATSHTTTKLQRGDLFKPRAEYVVICPTIPGHSGGPVVNQQGEVIGILSRADPAEKQRCYIAPTKEWKTLVKQAKFAL